MADSILLIVISPRSLTTGLSLDPLSAGSVLLVAAVNIFSRFLGTVFDPDTFRDTFAFDSLSWPF